MNTSTKSSSRQLIAQRVFDSLDNLSIDKEHSSISSNHILAIIAFCKKRFGISKQLYYAENISDEDLFQYNGLHLHEVQQTTWPKKEHRILGNLFLFVLENSDPILQFSEDGKYYYFDPVSGLIRSSEEISKDTKIVAAYEIYRQLPWFVKGPSQLLNFSISGDKNKFIFVCIVSFLVMLLGLSTPILTKFLTNTVIPSSSLPLLVETLIPCLIILITSSAMKYLQGLVLLLVESTIDLKMQTAVWQKVYKLPLDFFEKFSPGDLLSRVNAVSAIRKAIGNQAALSILQLLFAGVFFILMIKYDLWMAVGALVVSALTLVFVGFTVYMQTKYQVPFVEQQAELTNFAYQAITGIPQIRSTNTEPFMLEKWAQKVEDAIISQRNIERWQGILASYTSINQPLGTVILFAILVQRLVLRAEPPQPSDVLLILANFMPFYSAYTSFNAQLQTVIISIGEVIAQVVVQWGRAKDIFYAQEEVGYNENSIPVNVKGEITFTNIGYSFNTETPALFSNINFNVKQGAFVALTGESGCGKSTLMKLILGFIDPTEGSILIDGVPLKSINIRSYRRQIGVVLQTTKLPPGPIYDIVCAGRNFTESQVWEALEQCAIADQIKEFPMGLDTVLTESPAISGGQRQRIALARALISKPKILLLDEATSALDAASQKSISETINNLGVTRIAIAHRLSTIKEADQIIYIKNRTIFAKGTFEELNKQNIFSNH